MKILPKLFSHQELKGTYKTASDFSVFVYRAIKKGNIKQIKKGLYALINPSTGFIFANKFQIASHLFTDAYFSYHEALEYYGLANQSFTSTFNYLTKSHARDLEFDDILYKAKKATNNLFILDRIKEEDIRVVSLERAIVDSIDCLSLAGGLEEVEYSLINCPVLNTKDIISLLKAYNKNFLYQKVGYLFEKHFGNKYSKEFYNECLKHTKESVLYLNCNIGESKLNAKWKLMIKKEKEIPNEIF